MKKNLLMLIVILFVIVSCKKDQYPPYSPGLLKKVINNSFSDEYEYYGDSRLKAHRNYYEGELQSTTEYSYNQDTIRIHYISNNGTTPDRISYKIGSDTIISHESELSNFQDYFLAISSGDDCGPSLTGNYTKGFEEYGRYNIIEYFDQNCSTRVLHYNNGQYEGKSTYMRDNNHSWDTSVSPEYWGESDLGNVIEYHRFNSTDSLLDIYYYEYEYNSYGYPTSMKGYSYVELGENDSIKVENGIQYFIYY